jgi:hypothetical protein
MTMFLFAFLKLFKCYRFHVHLNVMLIDTPWIHFFSVMSYMVISLLFILSCIYLLSNLPWSLLCKIGRYKKPLGVVCAVILIFPCVY